MNLTGRWKYKEDYGYGATQGELYLEQNGEELVGRLVFSDTVMDEKPYMLQEFLRGKIDGRRVTLDAFEYDIIFADFDVSYELDHWCGMLEKEDKITGVSVDVQGVQGDFEFVKYDDTLPFKIF